MPEPVLTVLKYLFLALLYLFFLRVLRAIWVEMREPKVVAERPKDNLAERFAMASAADREEHLRAEPREAPRPSGRSSAGPSLVATAPPERAGSRFPISDEVTIGRSPGCAISLSDDTFISTVHARVFNRDGEWWVEDLGSTNGTLLNDVGVTAPTRFRPGDRLRVGQTVLELSP